jgi:hypothetical protein
MFAETKWGKSFSIRVKPVQARTCLPSFDANR